MRQIAIGIARRRHALVDLKDMEAGPGNDFVGQGPQHLPGGGSAADGQHKAPAVPWPPHEPPRQLDGRLPSDVIGIVQHFDRQRASR